MKVKKVWAAYFSATGTTEKVVKGLAKSLAKIKDRMGLFRFYTSKGKEVGNAFSRRGCRCVWNSDDRRESS